LIESVSQSQDAEKVHYSVLAHPVKVEFIYYKTDMSLH